MRPKRIISASEARAMINIPKRLRGAYRFFHKMIFTSAMFGCFELYLSPNYKKSCRKKRRQYYKMDKLEERIVFDEYNIESYIDFLKRWGYDVEWDWFNKEIIIKWR